MDLNTQNAILQQLASTPGLMKRLQQQMGFTNAASTISEDAVRPAQYSFVQNPEHLRMLASQRFANTMALPYQVGSASGQTWPGDPDYQGLVEPDQRITDYVNKLMAQQPRYAAPPFKLPTAPPLQ